MFKLLVLLNINMDGQSVWISAAFMKPDFSKDWKTDNPPDSKFGALREYSRVYKILTSSTRFRENNYKRKYVSSSSIWFRLFRGVHILRIRLCFLFRVVKYNTTLSVVLLKDAFRTVRVMTVTFWLCGGILGRRWHLNFRANQRLLKVGSLLVSQEIIEW